jgi:hypothetical protein
MAKREKAAKWEEGESRKGKMRKGRMEQRQNRTTAK